MSNNIVLGGYSWEDIQDMAHVLMNAGTVAYKEKNGNYWENKKRPLNNADEARIIAADAARYGVHPLSLSVYEIKGELVIVPPMDALYRWESENGGLFRMWLPIEQYARQEYGKQVQYLAQKVWGIPRKDIAIYQQMFRDTLALYDGIYEKKEAVDKAKLETFEMLGTMGEGSAKASELGNVQGRGTEFTLRKRADADLIVKALGRPTPADVAARMLPKSADFAQLPNNWTVEQKMLAANQNAEHRKFLALPREEQKAIAADNRKMLWGDHDEDDPYGIDAEIQQAKKTTEPAPEVLQGWLNKLNSLPEVNGFFADVEDLRACINIAQFPPINDTFAWKGIKATAIDCASKVNGQVNDDLDTSPRSLQHFKAELVMLGIEDNEFEQLVAVYHDDPDTAWDMLQPVNNG